MNKVKTIILTTLITTSLLLTTSYFFYKNSVNLVKEKYQKKITQLENSLKKSYKLNHNGCSETECLFYNEINDEYLGNTSFWGYYTPTTKKRIFSEENVKCDSFTITVGGYNDTVARFVRMVDGGNTVNSLNENNDPVVNISLENLSQSDKQKILNSTPDSEVVINVFFPKLLATEAPACASFFKIKKVRQ